MSERTAVAGLGADSEEGRQDPRPGRAAAEIAPRWGWVAVAGMTTAVIVFSAIRGLVRGYQPLGDNALIELRAWDVFTADRPVIGTWSSASLSAGTDVNHPGPLLFDVLAVPVRLFGGPAGLALGGAAINVAAVWASVLAARRTGGSLSALVTALATAVLAWSLGSEVLYDVWQPNVLVLPFYAVLILVWATALGHGWALPLAVIFGSLCLQAHLSYLFLVPALLLTGVAGLVWRDRTEVLARQGRWLGAAVAVGLVLWAQPLWEQLRGGDEGNLARLLSSNESQGEELTGLSLAVRMLGEVVAIPPAFARPGYETSVPLGWVDGPTKSIPGDLASFPVALAGIAIVGGSLALLAIAARRRGDGTIVAGGVVLAVAVVAGLASAAITPFDNIGLGLSPHKYRWMWSIGAFAFTLLTAAIAAIVVEHWPPARRAAALSAVVAAAALSLLTLPVYIPAAGPVEQYSAFPIVESLRQQVRDTGLQGTVLVDPRGMFFAEPFTFAVMAELARDGVQFVVPSDSLSRQVGPRRLDDGTADTELTFRHGADAEVTPPGSRRIAYDPGDDRWPGIAVFVRELDG